ncbi:hypothetical protein V6N12_047387 [Hibiscus sabdariffa]|uniref:Reverse transcriptase zinc-binding domain-containing protein n=1 Tax=Hibiscus sabdariffa TaxID=183260 RepID=A0ABR2DAP8_9ROSI
MFLWTVCNNHIFTNVERVRRNLTDNPRCMICDASDEDVSHALRECVEINAGWLHLVKPDKVLEFFSMDIRAWIYKNLLVPSYFPIQAEDWDLLFGSILWNAWLMRNQHIFNPDGRSRESLISQSYRMRDEARSALSPVVVLLLGLLSVIGVNRLLVGLNKNWEVSFNWVNRQCNSVVDKLVKIAKDLPLPFYRFLDSPTPVLDLLNGDAGVGSSSVSC